MIDIYIYIYISIFDCPTKLVILTTPSASVVSFIPSKQMHGVNSFVSLTVYGDRYMSVRMDVYAGALQCG